MLRAPMQELQHLVPNEQPLPVGWGLGLLKDRSGYQASYMYL
jgi:hypothetical protein